MLEMIGRPRTWEHISGGFQFAGGFPEIFFEWFGPIYAWPFIFGAGYLAAALTALMVKGVLQGRYASAFRFRCTCCIDLRDVYRRHAQLRHKGTYLIKIAALAAALLIEARLARAGVPLVPWIICRIPQNGWFERLRFVRSQIGS